MKRYRQMQRRGQRWRWNERKTREERKLDIIQTSGIGLGERFKEKIGVEMAEKRPCKKKNRKKGY
jgi:hypothetical protein